MSSLLLPKAKEALLKGDIDLDGSDIRAVIVDVDDYADTTATEFLSDITAGAQIAHSANLANKTCANGKFDSDDATFTSVTGDVAERVYLYVHTGTASTSRVISRHDVSPNVTPNGSGYTVAPHPTDGWFSL